jgi:hypothetical protein
VIALPPELEGAVQFTVAAVSPAVAVPMVGALGSVAEGDTAFEAFENEPVPTALMAATLKV